MLEDLTWDEFARVVLYKVEVGVIGAAVSHLGREWCVKGWHWDHQVLLRRRRSVIWVNYSDELSV